MLPEQTESSVDQILRPSETFKSSLARFWDSELVVMKLLESIRNWKSHRGATPKRGFPKTSLFWGERACWCAAWGSAGSCALRRLGVHTTACGASATLPGCVMSFCSLLATVLRGRGGEEGIKQEGVLSSDDSCSNWRDTGNNYSVH